MAKLPWAVLTLSVASCFATDAAPPSQTATPLLAAVPVGTLPGSFTVDEHGAATYRIPIDVPPGRAGLAPQLALTYSSLGENGPLGVGWSIAGLSRIHECALSPSAAQIDGVTEVCLDGRRLVTTADGSFRTIPDGADRITLAPDGTYLVERRDGRRVGLALRSGTTYVTDWIEDRSGNRIEIDWHAADLPGEIRYNFVGAGDAATPTTRILFGLEPRPDILAGYDGGALYGQDQRLLEIDVRHQGERVRRYQLTYTNGDDATSAIGSGRSRLRSVEVCKTGVCMPATTFDWQVPHAELADAIDGPDMIRHGVYVLDLNGDGADDLIWCRDHDDELRWTYALSNGSANVFAPSVETEHGCYQALGVRAAAADVDHDGFDDLVFLHGDRGEFRILHGSPDGIFKNVGLPAYGAANGFTLADVDGDGTADLVSCAGAAVTTGPSIDHWHDGNPRWVWYPSNNDVGFGDAVVGSRCYPTTGTLKMAAADLDADGTMEIVSIDADDPYATAVFAAAGPDQPLEPTSLDLPDFAYVFAHGDFNGDGHYDAMSGYEVETDESDDYAVERIHVSRGHGSFQEEVAESATIPQENHYPFRTALQVLMDYDSDGNTDVIRPRLPAADNTDFDVETPWEAVLSHPSFGELGPGLVGIDREAVVLPWSLDWNRRSDVTTAVGDFDGDSFPDLLIVSDDGATRNPDYSSTIRLHAGAQFEGAAAKGPGDLIRRVTDGLGKQVELEYVLENDPELGGPCHGSYAYRCPSDNRPLVSRYTVDGLPATELSYAGRRYDGLGRRDLGFTQRVILQRRGAGQLPWETVIDADDLAYDEARHTYPFAGRAWRTTTRIWLTTGDALYQQTRVWSEVHDGSAAPTWFVAPVRQRTAVYQTAAYDGLGLRSVAYQLEMHPPQPVSMVDEELTWDPFQSLEQRHRLPSAEGFESLVDISYDNRTDDWLIGLPLESIETSITPEESVTRNTEYEHDQAGRLYRTILLPNDSQLRLQTTHGYDSFGNVISVEQEDGNGELRTTTALYDPATHIYPVYIVDPVGHQTWLDYEEGLGVMASVLDEAGVRATFQYDDFGRLRQRSRTANGVPAADVTTIAYERILGGTGPTPVRLRESTAGHGELVVEQDAGGRTLSREWDGHDGRVRQTYGYDALNRLTTVTEPYYVTDPPAGATVYRYDNANRPVKVEAPDLTETFTTYDGAAVTRINAREYPTTVHHDSQGRPVRSVDSLGTVTCFEHGPFDSLRRVIQNCEGSEPAPAAETSVDALGRAIVVDDPAAGRYRYRYDGFGDLVAIVDGNDEPIELDYDAARRLIRRTDRDGDTAWIWDVDHPGKLYQTISPDGVVETTQHDDWGRPIATTTTIDGVDYTAYSSWDAFGRLGTITYPRGAGLPLFRVRYVHDGNGQLDAIENASTGFDYWRAVEVDAGQRVTLERYGNGVESTRSYDPMGRLDSVLTSLPASAGGPINHNHLEYDYDDNGNLAERRDLLDGQFEHFTYDALDRLGLVELSPATGLPPVVTTADYDVYGNFTDKSDVGSYDAAPGGRVERAGTRTYRYDDNGNVISRSDGLAIAYTPFDKPRTITAPDREQIRLRYDAGWNRVVRRDDAGTVVTLGGLYERRLPAAATAPRTDRYLIGAGGRVFAQVERHIPKVICRPGAPCESPPVVEEIVYVHDDHLGSPDVITGADGEEVERLSFDAWGRRRNPDWSIAGAVDDALTVDRGFTGHTGELDAGLVHMRGRMYDPVVGRFLGADPYVQAAGFSQSHNRYSYALNSPLSATDPTGYCLNDLGGCGGSGWQPAVGFGLGWFFGALTDWLAGLGGSGGGGGDPGAATSSNRPSSSGKDDDGPRFRGVRGGFNSSDASPRRPPPQLQIGSSVHDSICAYYVGQNMAEAKEGERAATAAKIHCDKQLVSIADGLDKYLPWRSLGRIRADIFNLNKGHAYEIKSAASYVRSKLAMERQLGRYIERSATMGVAVVPGPNGAPGTTGIVNHDGVNYFFFSPEAGNIIYTPMLNGRPDLPGVLEGYIPVFEAFAAEAGLSSTIASEAATVAEAAATVEAVEVGGAAANSAPAAAARAAAGVLLPWVFVPGAMDVGREPNPMDPI